MEKQLLEAMEKLSAENKRLKEEKEELIRQLEDVNKKLHYSENFKSNFLSNFRNEINNPVSAVLGLARNMKIIDPTRHDKIKKMSELIYSEMKDLDFQLRNIFTAADLEAGEAKPEVMNVNLKILVNNTIDLVRDKLEFKELKLVLTFDLKQTDDKNCELFKTDAGKLQLILLNLLINAIEYSPSRETIELNVSKNNNEVMISVTDHGAVVEVSDKEQLFNRLPDTAQIPSKKRKGAGLKLTVTKDLLEIISGTIDVQTQTKKVLPGKDSEGSVRTLQGMPKKVASTSFIIQLSELNEISELIFSIDGDYILFKL